MLKELKLIDYSVFLIQVDLAKQIEDQEEYDYTYNEKIGELTKKPSMINKMSSELFNLVKVQQT